MSLGSVLQENLLVLLTYNEDRAKLIRNTVGPEMFSGMYREFAVRIYDYLDRYGEPPKDHLPDLFEDILSKNKGREINIYLDILTSISEMQKRVNTEYITNQLETFVRRQSLRSISIDLSKALLRDTEEGLDEADALIRSAKAPVLKLFDPGTRLSDKTKALKFLESSADAFPTGIRELDRRNFGPTRKELLLFIALAKMGKTWFLIQLAKMAVLNQLRICHISLEMSEVMSSRRYFQNLFSIPLRDDKQHIVRFDHDSLGRITGFRHFEFMPKLHMEDPDIENKLDKLIDQWKARALDHIIVKQFPTGRLTVNQLEAYLDNLEATEKFVPDLLIVDYPDLMALGDKEPRFALDEIYKDLRGLMVERNIAGAIVSQSNRAGSKSKKVRSDNVAEAWTKVAHADTIVTFSQTEAEKKLGLARLFVLGRNDEDKLTVCISQNYGTGQFVIDSSFMHSGSDYSKIIERELGVDSENL